MVTSSFFSLLTSSGPCQFPTLGFVVDRFWKNKCHVPESFYSIRCRLEKDDHYAELKWQRNRLFDKAACFVLYELCIDDPVARVMQITSKPTRKWYVFFQLRTDVSSGSPIQ